MEKIAIELLGRGFRNAMPPSVPRLPLTPARSARTANSTSKRWGTVAGKIAKRGQETTEGDGVFTVALMVAAVGEGEILADGSRKTRDVLENISRFVSKEQNTTVQVSGESKAIEIKMRVFVQNSIEAKAVGEYMTMHPQQQPAAFVLLIGALEMAVVYSTKGGLDPSSAAVADRLRKQAKTRAVRLVREAIASPQCCMSSKLLRGYGGPQGPVSLLRSYIASRSVPVGGAVPGRRYIAFNAKNKPHEATKAAYKPSQAHPSSQQSSQHKFSGVAHAHHGIPAAPDPQSTALFPVNLFVTAIADGVLARDTQQKAKERLGLIVSKIPKEQNTTVELNEGTLELKMRVFVSNSEDAKAVSEYIQSHSNQIPSPFVVLARDLPMALLYDPTSLDLSDASVADRLRKQAKTRAVKLIREVIGESARTMGAHVLRGHSGASAVAEVIEPLVLALSHTVPGQPTNKKYLAFAARSKAGPSPYTSPALPIFRPAKSPPKQLLVPLEFDDEMCVGALRSLASHAFSEAENSAAERAPPGARWWDNVELVKIEDINRKQEKHWKGWEGIDQEQGEQRLKKLVVDVRLGGQEGVREKEKTQWHICGECSTEQRSSGSASSSPNLEPIPCATGLSPSPSQCAPGPSPSESPQFTAALSPENCVGTDHLKESVPRSESVSSSHSAASTKMDRNVALTQDFASGPASASKEKKVHVDIRACSTSSGRLPVLEQGCTSKAYGMDWNVPSSPMQEDFGHSSRNRLGAKRPHEFRGREKSEEDAFHRPKRSQRVA